MNGHGFCVDWWTFGILIYEMVTGRPPFMHSNNHKLGTLIRQGKIIYPDPIKHGIAMSDDLKDIINQLLEKNPMMRLGSKNDADEIINHPWFQDIEWDKLMKEELPSPFIPDMDKIRKKRQDTVVNNN